MQATLASSSCGGCRRCTTESASAVETLQMWSSHRAHWQPLPELSCVHHAPNQCAAEMALLPCGCCDTAMDVRDRCMIFEMAPDNLALVLQGWEAKELLYYGRHEKQPMKELGITFETDLDKFLGKCEVVSADAS